MSAVKSVGIRDVAKLAGVSVTTVSHVLNDTPQMRVAEETRVRVREAAKSLGYEPNRMARALRTNKSGLIGLLSEEIATTPHAGRIILGAQDAAREHDLTLVIVNTERESNGNSHRDDVQTLIDRQVEAVLYATMYHRQVSLPPNLQGVPAVLIDSTDRAGIVPAVVPDEVGGAVAAVTHLVEAGHRRIAFLNNDDDVPATHERLIGFRQVLEQHGIPIDESLIVQAPSETLPAYALARDVLARPDRPTALFCYNDRMAMGAYRAAAELGLDIPERPLDRRIRQPGAHRREPVPRPDHRGAAALRDGRVGGRDARARAQRRCRRQGPRRRPDPSRMPARHPRLRRRAQSQLKGPRTTCFDWPPPGCGTSGSPTTATGSTCSS